MSSRQIRDVRQPLSLRLPASQRDWLVTESARLGCSVGNFAASILSAHIQSMRRPGDAEADFLTEMAQKFDASKGAMAPKLRQRPQTKELAPSTGNTQLLCALVQISVRLNQIARIVDQCAACGDGASKAVLLAHLQDIFEQAQHSVGICAT